MKNNKSTQLRRMYEESEKIINCSMGTVDEFSNFENEQEKEFYITLRNFFMEQKQKEIIEKGLF